MTSVLKFMLELYNGGEQEEDCERYIWMVPFGPFIYIFIIVKYFGVKGGPHICSDNKPNVVIPSRLQIII